MFQEILDVNAILARVADLRQRRKALLKGRELDSLPEQDKSTLTGIDSQLGFASEQLHEHELGAHFPGQARVRTPQPSGFNLNNLPKNEDDENAAPALEQLSTFLRTGKILQTDNPLHIYTSPVSGGTAATIPTEILSSLASYFANDAFARAGATQYNTEGTAPLVKPVVSAGSDFDTFVEGQSATDSKPMEVDSFTFGGSKYSRLVKVSEEALMNSALDLPSEIVSELAASLVNTFTHAATTALVSALQGNAGTCFVDRTGYTDIYGALLALLLAVPPRWDSDSNVFMCSRYDLRIIKDVRSTQNEPLFDPTSGTIFGKRVVINDYLTRVVYGNFQGGAFIRKTPFTIYRLNELYSAEGHIGFRATQFTDSKFLASVHAVPAQPLFYTDLDAVGS
jgi:HK97 family phage major capsid protein